MKENSERHISIFTVIAVGYAILVFIIIGISVLSIQRINFIADNLKVINYVNSAKQRIAIDYRGSVHDRSILVRDVILAEEENYQQYVDEIRQKESDYSNAKQRMQNNYINKNNLDPQETSILSRIDNIENQIMPLIKNLIDSKPGSTYDDLHHKIDAIRPLFINWLATINEFINLEEEKNKAISPIVVHSVTNFKLMMYLNSIIAIILGSVIAFLIIRFLSKILGGDPQTASLSVKHIAKGDLTKDIDLSKGDKSMLYDIFTMRDRLKHVITDIKESAEEIIRSTQVVAASSADARISAVEQNQVATNSVEQIEIITQGTARIAEISRQTEANSEKTVELSQKGNEAMKNTSEAIKAVNDTVIQAAEQIRNLKEKSSEISGSADLIAEVADQTNLLALNAAIEAARAGEHGKGFAVVADEVRKLAERTGQTTSQITKMINDIQKEIEQAVNNMQETLPQVEKGLELAEITSDILNEIQTQAGDSLSRAKQVSESSQAQEDGIRTIQQYLDEMAKMSSDTQLRMEENVHEVDTLDRISNKLNENTSFFKI